MRYLFDQSTVSTIQSNVLFHKAVNKKLIEENAELKAHYNAAIMVNNEKDGNNNNSNTNA